MPRPFGIFAGVACRSLLAGAALGLAACGPDHETTAAATGGAGGGGGDGVPPLAVVFGAPTSEGDVAVVATATIEGYASSAAARGALTLIGTSVGAYQAKPCPKDSPTCVPASLLPISGDEPDLPFETGVVRAAAAFQGGGGQGGGGQGGGGQGGGGEGLLVAADAGIFFATDGLLTRSAGHEQLFPLGVRGIASRIADDDADGEPETHLALRTDAGLVEWRGGELTAWTVGQESGAPSAALGREDRVFVAWETRVYELDKAAGVAYPLVFDIGRVHDIACASQACDPGAVVLFATSKGLVERSAAGQYTLYTLAAEGGDGVAVQAFALDAKKQRLFAVAEDGTVLRVRLGDVPVALAKLSPSEFAPRAAVDKTGDVWVGSGTSVTALGTGTPLSFATDVRAVVGEYCAPCHKGATNGATPIDFESYDVMVERGTKALDRILAGTMPPSGWPAVPKEQAQLIADWLVTKAP